MNKKKREGSERQRFHKHTFQAPIRYSYSRIFETTLDSESSMKKNKFLLPEFFALMTVIANA